MQMTDIKKLRINKYYRQPISKKEMTELQKSIIEKGILKPLVIEGNVIVDGMIRFEIAKQLGYTLVPTITVGEYNEK